MKYPDFIRSKPCSISGCPNKSVLAHQRILGGGGFKLKPPDTHAVPLCEDHHNEEHSGSITFWLKYFPEYDVSGMRKEMVQLLVLKLIIKLFTEYIRFEG